MPAYIVQIDPTAAPLVEGSLNAAVFAEDAAAARLAAASLFNNDRNTYGGTGTVSPYYSALWAAATVTEIVARTDLEGSVLRVQIPDATTPIDISITAGAADVVDDVCAAMVTALNLDAQIAGAVYSVGNLLTVAETTDTLGDKTVICTWIMNGVETGLVGAITDGGAAGAALSVQMALDAVALPNAVARW